MVDNGKWLYFNNRAEMEAYYKANKFAVDYSDYNGSTAAGWYYVYEHSRYFSRGSYDYYLVFQSAADRVVAVQEHMKEVAAELRAAKEYVVRSRS